MIQYWQWFASWSILQTVQHCNIESCLPPLILFSYDYKDQLVVADGRLLCHQLSTLTVVLLCSDD